MTCSVETCRASDIRNIQRANCNDHSTIGQDVGDSLVEQRSVGCYDFSSLLISICVECNSTDSGIVGDKEAVGQCGKCIQR